MNVLSIDIDFFFNGGDYAEYITHDCDVNEFWDMLYANKRLDLEPVNNRLIFVEELLKTKCLNAKVTLIEEHDEITNFFKREGIESGFLVNVDDHHDLGYEEHNRKNNLENWVLHCKDRGYISDYSWIRNAFSDIGDIEDFSFVQVVPWRTAPIQNLEQFDHVVICVSKRFTPRNYWITLPKALKEIITENKEEK